MTIINPLRKKPIENIVEKWRKILGTMIFSFPFFFYSIKGIKKHQSMLGHIEGVICNAFNLEKAKIMWLSRKVNLRIKTAL